jgi:hypothetical protein
MPKGVAKVVPDLDQVWSKKVDKARGETWQNLTKHK